jgi:NADPH2:quinone reductase
MRAIVRRKVGATPRCEEFPAPESDGRLSAVEVVAASLNKVDLVIADGIHLPLPLPSVAGREGIVRLDDGALAYVYFDDVSGTYGSMAETTLVDAGLTMPLPEGVAPDAALAAASTGLAAWVPIKTHAELKPGESVLVLGATGPVGRLAVQLAKRFGAGHVVAAGRNEDRLRPLLEHGADAIVALDGADDQAALRRATDGPYDVVIDYVFGAALEAALPTTNPGDPELEGIGGSRYVVVGQFEGNRKVTLGIESFFGLTIRGHQNSAVPHQERQSVLTELWSMIAEGKLSIATEMVPFEGIEQAWNRVREGAHRKLILTP